MESKKQRKQYKIRTVFIESLEKEFLDFGYEASIWRHGGSSSQYLKVVFNDDISSDFRVSDHPNGKGFDCYGYNWIFNDSNYDLTGLDYRQMVGNLIEMVMCERGSPTDCPDCLSYIVGLQLPTTHNKSWKE